MRAVEEKQPSKTSWLFRNSCKICRTLTRPTIRATTFWMPRWRSVNSSPGERYSVLGRGRCPGSHTNRADTWRYPTAAFRRGCPEVGRPAPLVFRPTCTEHSASCCSAVRSRRRPMTEDHRVSSRSRYPALKE